MLIERGAIMMKQDAIRISVRTIATVLLASSLAACGGNASVSMPGPAVVTPITALNQQGYATAVEGDYILRPSDVISVTVFREEGLSLPSVSIAADGRVSVPLLGPIQVAGMTASALEAQLEQALNARYLREPEVTVNVVSYASHQVTVEGAVEEPGVFEFRPGTRLSGGISMAKGPTRVAQMREVAVFRQTATGMEVAKFDYAAVRAGTMMDPILQPGDRIVVGTDGLSQFWQDLLKALPAFALFTAI